VLALNETKDIFFAEGNVELSQQSQILVLKRAALMVLFLPLNVTDH
jgi:hypothetical protein